MSGAGKMVKMEKVEGKGDENVEAEVEDLEEGDVESEEVGNLEISINSQITNNITPVKKTKNKYFATPVTRSPRVHKNRDEILKKLDAFLKIGGDEKKKGG